MTSEKYTFFCKKFDVPLDIAQYCLPVLQKCTHNSNYMI